MKETYNLEEAIRKYKDLLSNMSIYNTNYNLYKSTLFLLLDYRDKEIMKKENK